MNTEIKEQLNKWQESMLLNGIKVSIWMSLIKALFVAGGTNERWLHHEGINFFHILTYPFAFNKWHYSKLGSVWMFTGHMALED